MLLPRLSLQNRYSRVRFPPAPLCPATMLRRRNLPLRFTLLLLVAVSSRLQGQATTTTNRWPQRAWLFAGLGTGSIKGSLAGTIGGSYSPGALIFTVRRSEAAQWFGDGIDDAAFLVGIRSRGARNFVSAQLGPAAAHRSHTCDCSAADWTGPTRGAIAFDLAAQSNWLIPGIGFDVFGEAFPSSHRYAAVAVMLQLGWFGE